MDKFIDGSTPISRHIVDATHQSALNKKFQDRLTKAQIIEMTVVVAFVVGLIAFGLSR